MKRGPPAISRNYIAVKFSRDYGEENRPPTRVQTPRAKVLLAEVTAHKTKDQLAHII